VAKEKLNIQELTIPEVEEKIREMKKEVFTLRFRNAMRQLDNPMRIRFLKRDIARYTTALAEHQQGIRFLATGEDLPASAEPAAKPKAARPKAAKKTAKKTETKAVAKPAAKAKKEPAEAKAETKSASAAKSSEKPKRRVPWSRGKKKDKE
jgi:large subunit ribosomal protein L29